MRADLVVVGSGLFGATVAQRAAEELGIDVVVLEARDHPGGNVWSQADPATGIEVHTYGSHIFHTSDERVWAYVNRFTAFNGYQHRVWAQHRGEVYPMPINLGTINQFFRTAMGPDQARSLLREQAAEAARAGEEPTSLEDKAVSLIGRPLYEAFIRDYTAKQWQTDPAELPASIITRLPVRLTYDSRYFSDRYEGIPLGGYAAWVEAMLDSPRIEVRLGEDFLAGLGPLTREACVGRVPVVYTGALDRYFDSCFGELSWRTLDMETEVVPTGDFQGTAVINQVDASVPWTRVHEFRHYHPERSYPDDATVITREYSRDAGAGDEPYYPVGTSRDRQRLVRYQELAAREQERSRVVLGGRLGSYRYLDMDKTVAAALDCFEQVVRPWLRS
ncbi:UDP-galactopyranose mutase [Actinomyces sp. 2119]|uniref:UDP-galactopyranose mutase n=1 Tax=Actinomyces lilanjuaniae TaxID=2321394 RepID=A0ABM6Z3Z3_9ACTO|nr:MULTISPECIES: UDP-galactopyranose mutase [Actinomyces]AYD89958.1 UDP-galactopyranose mutase [Actinomyces lilanjuaniae]RJF42439.1 UDP-galactopyranose mutase [Actinomyces sp. 2119]